MILPIISIIYRWKLLVMITSLTIVNKGTMIRSDTTLLGCILSDCLKQKLVITAASQSWEL